MRTNWTGVGTALVSPFTKTGDLDEAGFGVVFELGERGVEDGGDVAL